MKRTSAFLSATLIAAGLAAGPALAEQQSASSNSGGAASSGAAQSQTQQNFSDQQLQNFASASQEIAGISQTYTQRLQNAEGADQQQQIRQEANDAMVEAVQNNNLEVEQFNQIGQAVQNDPQLMQRVQQMAQQQQ